MKKFLLVTLLALSLPALAQKQTKCFVSGTVLDSSNKPVPDAYIVLDSPPTTWEDLIVIYKADKNGKFSCDTFCPFPNGKQNLYISSPIPIENYSPFTPPFRTSRFGSRFTGQVIENKKNVDMDLSNVYVQFYYSTVVVRFVDETGNALVTNQETLKNIRIKLRLGKSVKTDSPLFSNTYEKAVRAEESAVAMNLPEGEWTVEISFDGKKWLKPNRALTVRKSDVEVQETLQMLIKTSG